MGHSNPDGNRLTHKSSLGVENKFPNLGTLLDSITLTERSRFSGLKDLDVTQITTVVDQPDSISFGEH